MIVSRIFPKDSENYRKFSVPISRISDYLNKFSLMQLFIVWSLTVVGINISEGVNYRYAYWNSSDWFDGLSKIIMSSSVFLLLLRRQNLWVIGYKRLSIKEIITHLFLAILFIIFGGFGKTNDYYLFFTNMLPYAISFLAGLLVFQFKLLLDKESGEWVVENWDGKIFILMTSCILYIFSVVVGFYLDDPLLSTVSMVNLPFSFVALVFNSHVRHLQRARFYPIMISCLFLCVRATWFILPLLMLFFTFRTVNYFKYGIVHPSFGVDWDESSQFI